MSLSFSKLRARSADGSLKTWIHGTFFASWLPPLDASLAFAVVYVGL